MRPYSKDLRLKILAACDRGMPRKEVSRVFGVSEPTTRRYLRLRRQRPGAWSPETVARSPAKQGAALEAALPGQVGRNPDLTLEEHRELFHDEHGMAVSTATISRVLKRLGLPLKKSPSRLPGATKKSARAGARG